MPRMEARPLTEAHSPDLATKSRAVHQHQKAPDSSQAEQRFKAQPLNKKILEGPVRRHHGWGMHMKSIFTMTQS